MAEQMSATVRLETGMRFDTETGSGHHVTLDAAEHGGGHNAGFRPMELLLVGLAGCTGMDVISILRKKRQQVTDYEVHVTGVRAQEHPMVLSKSPLSMSLPAIIFNRRQWHELFSSLSSGTVEQVPCLARWLISLIPT